MQLETVFPDRAYAFFSQTHKTKKENMPLLDKVSICSHIYGLVVIYDVDFASVYVPVCVDISREGDTI